ncbi:MAG: CehA/McbA family metallohydrolase [Gemmataceae bacterium]
MSSPRLALATLCLFLAVPVCRAQTPEPVDVEGQPLARNVDRLLQALEYLGHPAAPDVVEPLRKALKEQDAAKIQKLLDPHALILVTINPESRVKVKRGPAPALLQQGGYVPAIIKVVNEAGVTKPLQVRSPQALQIYSRGKAGEIKEADIKDRFLDVEIFHSNPLEDKLSGLKVQYTLALLHSSQAGKREATLHFDVGQLTEDLGFRGEVPVLFTVQPAIPVKLTAIDVDGTPTTGRFTFKDKLGKVYPPKSKRLAPDFFFQDQVYRHSGETVLLPPGDLVLTFGRGPEYYLQTQKVHIPEKGKPEITVKLKRWIDPTQFGFYSGDHHIHAAGCAHYTNPTEGVFAKDMFLHVKGEGLNVGCNLTWGPCYDFQRQFFETTVNKVSEPLTLIKYDIEVSGFGSQLLGHVCLLNLRDQTYPGSDGTKTKGWPTWTTPLMRWAKNQGAFTGYAHSANGLGVNPKVAALRNLRDLDKDKDRNISRAEAKAGLLPEDFDVIDTNKDGLLDLAELIASNARAQRVVYNFAVPEMDGIGAQEICVTTAQGLCDFISAMDTNRVAEWNCWYHIMNCGFPLKASGETDFPCISGSRVGQGRVYVQLGKVDKIDFTKWCEGLAGGRSYVSDGYAHALRFDVGGKTPGEELKLDKGGKIKVAAKVAFASSPDLGTAPGATVPTGKTRLVELIVNGKAVASKEVPADDKVHDLAFDVPIERSSWVALRQIPQLHTNPVNVTVAGAPIRGSKKSAQWCLATIDQLWAVRAKAIAEHERKEAQKTFEWAKEKYRKIIAESPAD